MTLSLMDLSEHPELAEPAQRVTGAAWPRFMLHDAVANRLWGELLTRFAGYQFVLVDDSGHIVATGNSAPLAWDEARDGYPDTGWDWALARAVEDHAARRTPTVQWALSISVAVEHRGQGISAAMVQAMKAIGKAHRLNTLLAPVRPSLKHRYPLTPIERYIHWTDAAGLPFDSWMRVHVRQGGTIVGACSRSMEIMGSVDEWEDWTGMRFVDSGRYVVPHALVPVDIDREADRGTYVEPNVWIRHRIE